MNLMIVLAVIAIIILAAQYFSQLRKNRNGNNFVSGGRVFFNWTLVAVLVICVGGIVFGSIHSHRQEAKPGTAQVVLDGARINEFDGLEYKDEKGNVIPGFDITYSYQGHEGEYSTIDTLKQRDDFSWEKVTAIMVFGSLLPNSSYRVEFPFKIGRLQEIT